MHSQSFQTVHAAPVVGRFLRRWRGRDDASEFVHVVHQRRFLVDVFEPLVQPHQVFSIFHVLSQFVPPNHALQRTRPSASGCKGESFMAGSLSLGR